MELTISEKNENKTIQRQEILGKLSFTGATPSNKEVQTELAKKLNTKPELIAVRNINTQYGGGSATFRALAYPTKEQYNLIEIKKIEEPKPEEKKENETTPQEVKAE
ncbi:hypothetical protein COV18_00125 [Candidatus Woesearchaeota archaeon CG10_big_fil_rev_8_21_14_0_10_37_12]|nr:MAG: hypothetical protein COV18_00125 [Candidatus Woesearchaeota archaeon CG10_big_fil_rev_8_21_14_0_10_37_12]